MWPFKKKPVELERQTRAPDSPEWVRFNAIMRVHGVDMGWREPVRSAARHALHVMLMDPTRDELVVAALDDREHGFGSDRMVEAVRRYREARAPSSPSSPSSSAPRGAPPER